MLGYASVCMLEFPFSLQYVSLLFSLVFQFPHFIFAPQSSDTHGHSLGLLHKLVVVGAHAQLL